MTNKRNERTPQTGETEEQSKSLRRSWKSSGPVAKLTVVFAGIAALSTTFYAVFSAGQWWVMGSQLKVMQDEQRPWLSIKGLPVHDKLPGPQGPGVTRQSTLTLRADIQNTGHTPAIRSHLVEQMNAKVCPDEFPAKNMRLLPGDPPYTYKTIFPGDVQSGESKDYFLDESTITGLYSKQCALYVLGTIHYCDLAGVAHYQNFCWKWHFGTVNEFFVCDGFNDGDQDHPEQKARSCPKD